MNHHPPEPPRRGHRGCRLRPCLVAGGLTFAASLWSSAQVSVLTYHNDLARTGQNLNETTLTPANVNTNTFGRLFSYTVDGDIYGQPLYVPNVAIPGKGTHNVVYVATEHDSVYAFDADSNAGTNAVPLWQNNFLNPAAGVTSVPGADEYDQIDPEIGITSTPVIDLSSGTIYVDAATKEVGGADGEYVHRLHALDLATGAEKFGGPVLVQAHVLGMGAGSDSSGNLPFVAYWELNRSGLLLLNGVVYLTYASYADAGFFHGWMLGYDAHTLALVATFNDTPYGTDGGIWQAGCAPAADANGSIYCITGNGSFYPAFGNYGDSFLRLALGSGGLQVQDYFTPFNQADLAFQDLDLGSGGPVLLPDTVGSATHPHLLVGAGKQGTLYLLDRDKLGHYNAAGDSQIVQELTGVIPGTFSTPAYFNNQIYYLAVSDSLKALSFTNGLLNPTPSSQAIRSFGFPGATPAVSANGTNDAIIWTLQTDTAGFGGRATLHAYDAGNVARELYNSSQAGSRDDPGGAIKFTVPTVANGKVYVGGASRLSVFGLARWSHPPALTPGGGLFTGSVQVSFGMAGPQAQVHYTLDGSAATSHSPVYSAPFTLTNSTVVRAVTVATKSLPSAEVIAFFAAAPAAALLAGFGGNGTGWTLNGGANVSGDVLTLTDGWPGESRSAFLNTPQSITNFAARFLLRTAVGASRVAFVLQNSPSGPSALSQGCLGFCGISPSAAVAFDVETGDPGYSFTDTGLATGGNLESLASTLPLDLGAGNPVLVALRYDGSVLNQYVADLNTGLTYETNYVIDLGAAVGGTNTAYIGFTAASGLITSAASIESFSFGPDQAPSVAILQPAAGAVFTVPQNVEIDVSATGFDGCVTNVQFFQGSLPLGQATFPPFAFLWTNVPTGTYALTAVATDNLGVTIPSTPVNIVVAPLILGVSRHGNHMILSWSSTVNCVLQVTTNLVPPVVWVPASQPRMIDAGQTTVTVPFGAINQFYRLSAP